MSGTRVRHPRMIMSTEGAECCGKTDFALGAPRPLVYLDFDFGLEGVRGRPPDEHHQYNLLAAEWMPETEAARYTRDVMRRFVADFRAAMAAKARSVVVDTFTAAWSGQRLARKDDRYIEMEEEFHSLIRLAYASTTTNVILIHHLRPDWKKDSGGKPYRAGTWSRDGMDGVANMMQLALRQRYVPPQMAGALKAADGRFEVDVLKCRENIGLVGQTFTGMDFVTLCTVVCPTVDWSK